MEVLIFQENCLCWLESFPSSPSPYFLCPINGTDLLTLKSGIASGRSSLALHLLILLLVWLIKDFLTATCRIFDKECVGMIGRYVDMIMNPDVATVFRNRAKVRNPDAFYIAV